MAAGTGLTVDEGLCWTDHLVVYLLCGKIHIGNLNLIWRGYKRFHKKQRLINQ